MKKYLSVGFMLGIFFLGAVNAAVVKKAPNQQTISTATRFHLLNDQVALGLGSTLV